MALYNVTVRTADDELTTVTVDAPTIADARRQALQQSETGSSVVSTTPISVDFTDVPPATSTTGVDPQDPLAVSETRTGVGDFFTPPATLGGFGPEGFIEGDLEGTARPDGGVFESTRAMPALRPESFTGFVQQAMNGDNGGIGGNGDDDRDPNVDALAAERLAQEGVLSDLDVEDISASAAVRQALERSFPDIGRAGPVSNFLRNQALNLFYGALPGQQIRAELDPTFREQLATRRATPTGSPTADALADAAFSEAPLSETRTPFTDYYRRLAESAGGTRSGFQEAADNLRFLRNLGVSNPIATGQFRQYFAPDTEQEADLALRLIQGARQGRFSPAVRRSGPSESEVFGDYLLETSRRAEQGLGTPNFLDFAAGRFGL